ncbi:MAG: antibiotic biosynthesis monooxygenase [Caulobacteraceae bacterium]|nr:antibiotic biosynthesis monooxygenase [Caulobacteraceae bacterium]
MIIVEGWVRLAAEEIERLRAAAVEMMRQTKATDPGCLEYAYAVDLAEPDLLRVIERWADQAALDAHFASPHMAMFRQAMAAATIEGASIKAYQGENIRVLMQS